MYYTLVTRCILYARLLHSAHRSLHSYGEVECILSASAAYVHTYLTYHIAPTRHLDLAILSLGLLNFLSFPEEVRSIYLGTNGRRRMESRGGENRRNIAGHIILTFTFKLSSCRDDFILEDKSIVAIFQLSSPSNNFRRSILSRGDTSYLAIEKSYSERCSISGCKTRNKRLNYHFLVTFGVWYEISIRVIFKPRNSTFVTIYLKHVSVVRGAGAGGLARGFFWSWIFGLTGRDEPLR